MKQYTKLSLLAILTVIALSCNDDDIGAPSVPDTDDTIVTITASTTKDTSTKIGFHDGGSSVKMGWSANDKFMVYNKATGKYAATFTLKSGESGQSLGQFDGTGSLNNQTEYIAVCPVLYSEGGVTPLPTLKHRGEVINGITQNGNKDMKHIDQMCYMNTTFKYLSGGQNEIFFEQQYALLTLKMGKPDSYVEGTHGKLVSLSFFNGVEAKVNALKLEGIANWNNEIWAYMLIDPVTHSGTGDRDLRFDITTDKGAVFQATLQSSKNHIAGKRYTADLVATKAQFIDSYTIDQVGSIPRGIDTWVITDAGTVDMGRIRHAMEGENFSHRINVILSNATTVEGQNISYLTNCLQLLSVSAPKAERIEQEAFKGCSNLMSVSLPEVTYVGDSVFRNCFNLASISLPKVTELGNQALAECGLKSIESISIPKVTKLGNQVFYRNTKMTSISLPAAEEFGYGTFINCAVLTSVNLPVLETIEGQTFFFCGAIESISLPMLTKMGHGTFSQCFNLRNLEMATMSGATLEVTNKRDMFTDYNATKGIDLKLGTKEFNNSTNVTTVNKAKKWLGYEFKTMTEVK